LTYELQDVDLNYKTIVDDMTTVDGSGLYTIADGGYGMYKAHTSPMQALERHKRFFFLQF